MKSFITLVGLALTALSLTAPASAQNYTPDGYILRSNWGRQKEAVTTGQLPDEPLPPQTIFKVPNRRDFTEGLSQPLTDCFGVPLDPCLEVLRTSVKAHVDAADAAEKQAYPGGDASNPVPAGAPSRTYCLYLRWKADRLMECVSQRSDSVFQQYWGNNIISGNYQLGNLNPPRNSQLPNCQWECIFMLPASGSVPAYFPSGLWDSWASRPEHPFHHDYPGPGYLAIPDMTQPGADARRAYENSLGQHKYDR